MSFPVKVYLCTKQIGFDFDIFYKKFIIHHKTKACKKKIQLASHGFTAFFQCHRNSESLKLAENTKEKQDLEGLF